MYLITFVVKKMRPSLVLIQKEKPQQLLTLKMYRDISSRVKHALKYGGNINKHNFSTLSETNQL